LSDVGEYVSAYFCLLFDMNLILIFMKNKFMIPLLVVMLFFSLGACDDNSDSKKAVTMEIDVKSVSGDALEVYPIDKSNLDADTLFRSKKILQKSGDSIVLGKEASEFVFHLTTNASWRLSKQKAWAATGSITWLINPQPVFGGGNSTARSSVKVNTSAKDRRAYIYFTTGDSSCVKKYVIFQKGNY
jgi:hypothetical protein